MRAHHRTDRVLAEFELMLGALAPSARRGLGAALVGLDLGARMYPRARGRRFSALDDAAAEAYLAALLARGGGLGQLVQRLCGLVAMCYYELAAVQREIGYQPGPFIAAVARRRLESYGAEIAQGEAAAGVAGTMIVARNGRYLAKAGHDHEDRPGPRGELRVDCDVVIVGSGAGGATTAAELAGAGLDVVMVEEGGYHPTESFSADSVRALRTLYRDGGGGMAVGRPSVLFAEGRCVGGSTVVNGGMSWPTPGRVLERWSADGVLGIGERDMEPYFGQAEARHSVGEQDPETIGTDSELMRAGAAALGWAVVPNRRAQLHCAGTNNCNSGCPTGAKRSTLVTSVPRALALGARLFADCRVDRITRSGRAVTGITGRFTGPGGARLTVRAGTVIVAGGAIQTPALLARSGLGSASGQLGRNLSLHPNTTVVAFFDDEVTGWHGVHQAFQVREFTSEGILLSAQNLPPPALAGITPAHGRRLGELMADYNRVVTAGPLVSDTGTGRVRSLPGAGTQVFYRLADADAARLVRGVELTGQALFAAGARRMLLPFDGAPEVRSPGELRSLLARPVPKAVLQVYSVHLMGTARMNEDPRRGVTDSYGAVHGVPGLFIADASLFPGPIGINPMETVIALALRNAQRLLGALRRTVLRGRVGKHRRGHLRVGPAGELRAHPVEDQQGCAGDLLSQRLRITDREERIGGAVHDLGWCGDLREPFAPAWRAVQLRKHRVQQAVARRRRVRTGAVENTGRVDAGFGGVELWRAGEHAGRGHGSVQDRRAIGPVDRWSAADVGHDGRGVLGKVVVDGARRDRAGADEDKRGDPRRVVQRQELCDETAGRDAHDVRAGDAEPVEDTDGVGDEVAQRVAGRVRVDGGRSAGVPPVAADDEPAGEPLDKLVVPGGDGGADQQQGNAGRRADGVNAQLDVADLKKSLHIGKTSREGRTHRGLHALVPG
jgi:choline dehydrogenase-like flavoprotein